MGIIRSGLLGPIQNTTGTVSGRIRRGQNVVTGRYESSTKPPTEEQLQERAKFGMLNSFIDMIKDLILNGFKNHSKQKYPTEVAYSYNCGHAFLQKAGEEEGQVGEWMLNFPKLVYSRGRVLRPEGASVKAIAEGLLFNWKPQPQSTYCQFADQATFLVYNTAKKKAITQITTANRFALQHLLSPIPITFAGDTLHCYMSFASANGKETGNSVYIGEVVWS